MPWGSVPEVVLLMFSGLYTKGNVVLMRTSSESVQHASANDAQRLVRWVSDHHRQAAFGRYNPSI